MKNWDAEFYNKKAVLQYESGIDLLNQLKINKNENILDIGCGTGNLSIRIAKRNPTCNVTAIDVDNNMIMQALNNLKMEKIQNIKFINADILSFQSTFKQDVIFSNSVIHWIDDKQALFHKIKTLLNSNGRVGIQIPSTSNLKEVAPLFVKTVEVLNLQEFFRKWKYPMKRISLNKLKKIIDSIEFKDSKFVSKKIKLHFKDHEDLLDFLRTAALVPILSRLSNKNEEKYLEVLLKLLQKEGENILHPSMKRIYIFLHV